MSTIHWDDFQKVGLVAGTVVKVEDFPAARKPACKLWVDCGEHGVKASSAQVTVHYAKKELLGRQVMCVVNFAPKNIGGFMSECLVTGFYREDGSVVLAVPDKEVPNGARLG
jgi:tRNA-binding protein